MANLAAVLKELQQERNRLDQAITVLSNLAGGQASGGGITGSGRRPLSAAARARIAAAQRARWASIKAKKGKTGSARTGGRVMSAAARRKIAAAQRARWAQRKAQQKKAA
jgi:hypothetical protein